MSSHSNVYSPFHYAWFTFVYFAAVWFVTVVVDYVLCETRRWELRDKYNALSLYKRRNLITYVLQLLMTTLALIAQLYGSSDVLFQLKDETSKSKVDWLVFAMSTVVVLYLWEMVYRLSIGTPLLVHHIIAILLMQLIAASFEDTRNIVYIRFSTLIGFHATTEQIRCAPRGSMSQRKGISTGVSRTFVSFIALFCYRLDIGSGKLHNRLFLAAAAQAFIFKTLVTVISIAYFLYVVVKRDEFFGQDPTNWNWFWYIAFFPLILTLYAAQVYACQILYKLAKKCQDGKQHESGRGPMFRTSDYNRPSRRESMRLLDSMELSRFARQQDQEAEMYQSWRQSIALPSGQALSKEIMDTIHREDESELVFEADEA